MFLIAEPISVPQAAKRSRRFSVVSNSIRRVDIENAFDRPNVVRYAGAVHDKDLDVVTHAHAFVELNDGRSVRQVTDCFDKPVIVKPLVGSKGDTTSFARAVRYLTHEHRSQQDAGKYLYPDAEVFASAGFDWRAAVDALTAREGRTAKPNARQVRLDVLQGRLTVREVRERYPHVYLDHRSELLRLEADFHEDRQWKLMKQYNLDVAAGLDVDTLHYFD